MTILRNLLETRALEDARYPLTAKRLVDWFGGNSTKAGVSVNVESAIGRTIAVYRAISLVSGAIGSLPLLAFKAGPERTPFVSAFVRDPHWDMTSMELWETALFHLLGWGDFYAEKVRDGGDAVRYLDPISPSAVKVEREETSRANPTGKLFEITYKNGTKREFTSATILHVPGPGYNGRNGLSPIGVARQGIGMALAAEEYGARLFGNGTLQQGFLYTDAVLEQPDADNLKDRWKAKMTGLQGAHDVAVLDRGLKFESLSINPADAQFIESRKFQDSQIATLYGIPPHLLGQVEKSTSWGTGIAEQNLGLVIYTLRPWIVRLEQRISRECLTRPNVAQFDTREFQRGDAKARAETNEVLIRSGQINRQEARLSDNLPPAEGADHFVIPANWMVLGHDGHPVGASEPAAAEGDAAESLEDAIALHKAHMNGTEPTSEASQQKMMDLMQSALAALDDTAPMVPIAMSMNGSSEQHEVRS